MRKARKKKKRSCPSCKPNKTGYEIRWAKKYFARLREAEREMREAKEREFNKV